jgi:histidinol-phosphatase (PHP family)
MHLRVAGAGSDEPAADFTVDAIESYVATAAARGVDEIGISEHAYYFRDISTVWSVPYTLERSNRAIGEYVEPVLEAKARGLPVKLGLEVDWTGDAAAAVDEFLVPYPWDYLLGSVHWIDGEAIDQLPGMWERYEVEEVWRAYFATLCDAARSGRFDVLSHPDLVKIFGNRMDDPSALYDHLAHAAADGGVAVEVSSAGLRKPVGELYPARELLAACRARGVPITLASDAHHPDLPGSDLDRCVELARSVGYETVTVFDRRTSRQETLT